MSADRQYAIAVQVYRVLGVDLVPEQTRHIEDLVEASIAEGGPGWPEFAVWLRDANMFWPSAVQRRAEESVLSASEWNRLAPRNAARAASQTDEPRSP